MPSWRNLLQKRMRNYKYPSHGYDYGPFARPFFEGAKSLRFECAACFRGFILERDGLTSVKERGNMVWCC